MDVQALEGRVQRLEFEARRVRRRFAFAFMAVVLLAIAPVAALARSHQFTDVPNGYLFHNDIDRVYDARITAGCSATTYCPEANVTRGQMAAFLSRTGGRVDYDSYGFVYDIATAKILATVTIRPGNVPGGTAFIKLDASGYAYANYDNEPGCVPCSISFWIDQRDSSTISRYSVATLHNSSTLALENVPGSITFVVQVPTGVDVTFDLYVKRDTGTGYVNAIGSLAATYYPFGGLGSDSLMPSSSSVELNSGPMPKAPGT